MSELNPCPQCGNEPELNVGHIESWVVCRSCGVAVASGTTTGDAAINGWNEVTANFKQPTKTLRDEFAMAAISGYMATESCLNSESAEWAVKHSYEIADLMLKERSKWRHSSR